MKVYQKVISIVAGFWFCWGLCTTAVAQSLAPFPDKTIQYIIPFPPAGESDLVARYQAEISAKKFGQPRSEEHTSELPVTSLSRMPSSA